MNQNNPEVQRWMARKFSRYPMRLREMVSATCASHVQTETRCVFGQVTLSAAPSKTFSFVSRATWPEGANQVTCEECIIDGIFEVLISADFHPICGVKFTLEEIVWDAVDSVPQGYYFAARDATRKILRLDEKDKNFAR